MRYLKAEQPALGTPPRVSHWIATVEYAYAMPSADPRIRRWNPLGFKLLEFVAEPEVLNERAATTPTTASPAAPPGTTKAATP